MKAVKEGKLPNLRRIEVNNCSLSNYEWPEVPEFSLWPKTAFDTSRMQKLVSNLTELTFGSFNEIDHHISTHLAKLSVLKLRVASEHSLLQLNGVISQGNLPNLSALSVYALRTLGKFLDEFDLDQVEKLEKLSFEHFTTSSQESQLLCVKIPHLQLRELNLSYSRSMTRTLYILFANSFRRLNTLKLKSCYLSSKDLRTLCQANVEGKLPQLRQLDISDSQKYEICDLFTHSARWNQLTTLCTVDFNVLNIDPEFLTSLKELAILTSERYEAIELIRCWPHLKKLQLDTETTEVHSPVCLNIIDGFERGLFPAVGTFRYSGQDISASDRFKLHKANIYIEQFTDPRKIYLYV